MVQPHEWDDEVVGLRNYDGLIKVPSSGYATTYHVPAIYGVEAGEVKKTIKEIKDELADIKGQLSELAEIKELLREVLMAMATETVECRKVTDAEARELIVALIDEHPEGLCYSDIIDALKLDPDLVIDVCDALAAEGKLKDLGPVGG